MISRVICVWPPTSAAQELPSFGVTGEIAEMFRFISLSNKGAGLESIWGQPFYSGQS